MDLDALQNLVNHLNDKSKRFSDAAKTIMDRAKSLDSASQDLTANPSAWAGKGAQAFQRSWMRFHGDALSSAINLDTTSSVLSKLANELQGHIDKINELNAQMAAMTTLTVGLVVVDVLQLGLDPVTDTATGASGAGDAAIMSEISTEEGAITELDSTIASEIDQVTAQIEDSTQLSQLDLSATDLNELEQFEGDLMLEEQGLIDPSTEADLIPDGQVQGGGFPEGQRLPYDPPGEVFEQNYDGSCLAACCKMVLSDDGIVQPEAYIRTAADVDAQQGGYLSNAPDALDALGSPNSYTYETDMTLNQLEDATAGGKSAIVSMNLPQGGLHAIVVDGVEDGMVLIRDPAGEAYKVTIEDFLKLWNGKAVIPTP